MKKTEFFELDGKLIRKDLINYIDIYVNGGTITIHFFSGKDLTINFHTIDQKATDEFIEDIKQRGYPKDYINSFRHILPLTKPSKYFGPAVDKLKAEAGINWK